MNISEIPGYIDDRRKVINEMLAKKDSLESRMKELDIELKDMRAAINDYENEIILRERNINEIDERVSIETTSLECIDSVYKGLSDYVKKEDAAEAIKSVISGEANEKGALEMLGISQDEEEKSEKTEI